MTTLGILTAAQLEDRLLEVTQRLGKRVADICRKLQIKPNRAQINILAAAEQLIMVAGGFQGGKSFMGALWLVIKYFLAFALHPPFPHQERELWVCADRIEDTVYEWGHIVTIFTTLGLIKEKHADPPRLVLSDGFGTTIKVKFTRDLGKLSGVSPLAILVCEAANVAKDAFDYLFGRTLGYTAPIFVSGTFEEKGHPWFAAMFLELLPGADDARAFSLSTDANEALFPEGKNDPKFKRMKARTTDRFYKQRIEGIPAPPLGLVYSEFDYNVHIMRDYEYRPEERLYLWHDPGYNHACALLFVQYYGGVVYVFDEIYLQGHTTAEIIDLAMNRTWWQNEDKHLVVDPNYGSAHHAQDSVKEIWMRKTGLVPYGVRHGIRDGIDRVKAVLRLNPETGGPQILVHTRCKGTLSELGVIGRPPKGEIHAYKWDVDDDGYTVGHAPIDKNNDALDAIRFGLVDLLGFASMPGDAPAPRYSEVSTPESRDDYGLWDSGPTFAVLGQAPRPIDRNPYTEVSTPESRGEFSPWSEPQW